MRRWLVLSALLLVAVLASPALALADDAPAPEGGPDGGIVLAVDEITGPEPKPRDAEENAARDLGGFEDREVQFTWAAAWLLTGALGLAVIAGGLFYEFRVRRPAQEAAGQR